MTLILCENCSYPKPIPKHAQDPNNLVDYWDFICDECIKEIG